MTSAPIPRTVADLNELDWKAFESFATRTLQQYYVPYRVDVLQTRLSHDGGRDGEGIYTIGEAALTIVYRIWIEVKKRSSQHVSLDDIGKNLVLASNEEDVGKLIVVTNGGYAPQVETEIRRFASRNRMSYALLGGADLLDIARAVGARDASPSPIRSGPAALEVQRSFSRQPNPLDSRPAGDLVVQCGDPVFLIVSVRRIDSGPPDEYTVEVSSHATDVTILPYTSATFPLAAGDHARFVFVVLDAARGLSESSVQVAMRTSAGNSVEVTSAGVGRVRVSSPLLASWMPPSRQAVLARWTDNVQAWATSREPSLLSCALVAYPGVGKSLLLSRLRAGWLRNRVGEIYLDAALYSRDADMAEALFELAFPLNPELLGVETTAGVETWLLDCGLDKERSHDIARAICVRRRFDANMCAGRELADLCACLLRRLSVSGPVVVVIEDLHFCQPSALDLLTSIHRILERSGDAHIGFVCTTRPFAATPTPTGQADWSDRLGLFFESTSIQRATLEAFSEAEAVALLQQTIPTLLDHHAVAIVEQVGRTPLALREAVAYFRTVGTVRHDATLDQLVIDPDRVRETVTSKVLEKATRSRLAALKALHPAWLADLLDAAACVGRYFELEAILPAGWTWDASQTVALELCEALDVLRPFEGRLYMFDHDLLRTTIVEGWSQGRQQRIAGALCDREAFRGRAEVYGRLLYQAGRYHDAAGPLREAAERAITAYRFADAMESLRLCLVCTDPATSTHLGTLTDMDVAIAHTPAPRAMPASEAARHEAADILFLLLQCIGATAVFASRVADTVLTEATLLARHFGDRRRLADLRAMTGIHHFERDELAQAVVAHEDAERLYADLGGPADQRAANLVRWAIAERQQDRLEASRATLHRAHRMAPRDDTDLRVRITLNAGASYLGSDLTRVQRYWTAALRMATGPTLVERRVHALLDVGYLELLRDRHDEAAAHLSEGYWIAQRLGLDNSILRGASNLACLYLVRGERDRALELLLKAEEIGIRHGIGRRLWRVRANLATALELAGKLDHAYAIDVRLAVEVGTVDRFMGPWRRAALPTLNLALRAMAHPAHRRLVETLARTVRDRAVDVCRRIAAGDGAALPLVLASHLKLVEGHRRFIVTE